MSASAKKLIRSHTKEDKHFEDEGIRAMLKTYNGRRLAWWLLSEAGIFQNPFASNALVMAKATGKMELGQALLLRILDVNDESYLRMMQENQQLQNSRREAIRALKGEDYET